MATPRTDPALADPLFAELRQHHPEVDVILLPQPAPVPEVATATKEQRDALAAVLDGLVDDLLAWLSREPAWESVERSGQWHTDGRGQSYYEAVIVVRDLEAGSNIELLRSTGATLVRLGWRARPVDGNQPRLVARRQGFAATAAARATSLLLTVRTPLVRDDEAIR